MRQFIVNNIGKISHSEADDLMRIMQAKRIDDEIIDTLLICEHEEIVTIGPRARNDGIKASSRLSTSPVDRGRTNLAWTWPTRNLPYIQVGFRW